MMIMGGGRLHGTKWQGMILWKTAGDFSFFEAFLLHVSSLELFSSFHLLDKGGLRRDATSVESRGAHAWRVCSLSGTA